MYKYKHKKYTLRAEEANEPSQSSCSTAKSSSKSSTEVSELQGEFNQTLIPSVSAPAYKKEWDLYVSFLKSFDEEQPVNMATLQAYLMVQMKSGYAPTTISSKR